MPYFKRTRFSGIAPAVSPKLLGDQFGTKAYNLDFERGNLKPMLENGGSVYSLRKLQGFTRSIYYYETPSPDEYWLQWAADYVKAVPGPIPGDTSYRLYWTGDGTPKYSTFEKITAGNGSYPTDGNDWDLGIPAPATAPQVTIQGELDPDIDPVEEYAWVYTYVSTLGEEGPPSPASILLPFTPTTQTALIRCDPYAGADQGRRPLADGTIRIYRSNTGSTATYFQFVEEISMSEGNDGYEDNLLDVQLGEVLPSEDWIGPPDGGALYPDGSLQGLIAIANGVFAGHVGKRLCMSEPYMPHAWPIANRITLERDIVAIGTTGNGIVALTEGKPYFVTGVEPSAMTAITIDLAQSCNNKFSVVDMGDYLLYCGPDGLCAVSGGEGKVVTEGLIDITTWREEYKPDEIKAFFWEGRYIALIPDDNRIGWIYDPRASEAALSWVDSVTKGDLRGGYTVLKDGACYLIDDFDIVPFATGKDTRKSKWASKTFVAEAPCSMAWLSVNADFIADPEYPVNIIVFVDGIKLCNACFHCKTDEDTGKKYFRTTLNIDTNHPELEPKGYENLRSTYPITRLPPLVGTEFSFEIQAAIQIDDITIATTIDELRAT